MTTVDQLKRYMASWVPTKSSGTPYIVNWRAALSNMDWTDYAAGLGICYRDGHGERSMVLCDVEEIQRKEFPAESCAYIVDDGETALPYFVTGWCLYPDARGCNEHLPTGYVLLRKLRPHAPYGGLGPRRTWHLLISPAEGEVS